MASRLRDRPPVNDLFARTAARAPGAVCAGCMGTDHRSPYAELNARAVGLAARVRECPRHRRSKPDPAECSEHSRHCRAAADRPCDGEDVANRHALDQLPGSAILTSCRNTPSGPNRNASKGLCDASAALASTSGDALVSTGSWRFAVSDYPGFPSSER